MGKSLTWCRAFGILGMLCLPTWAYAEGLRELADAHGIFFGSMRGGPLQACTAKLTTSCISQGQLALASAQYELNAKKDFNTWIIGAFFGSVHPEPNKWNFWRVDKEIEFAVANNMAIQIVPLLYHYVLPVWIGKSTTCQDALGKTHLRNVDSNNELISTLNERINCDGSPVRNARGQMIYGKGLIPAVPEGEFKEIIKNHIQTIVKHVREKIVSIVGEEKGRTYPVSYEVANENICNPSAWGDKLHCDPKTHVKHNLVFSSLHEPNSKDPRDYIALAFKWAREADRDAKLFYNDYGNEGLAHGPYDTKSRKKSAAVYSLVKHLKKATNGAIDAVGLQMHVSLDWNVSDREFAKSIRRYCQPDKNGKCRLVDVFITEMDVAIGDWESSPKVIIPAVYERRDLLEKQASIYKRVISACVKSVGCKMVLFWGFDDLNSWLNFDRAGNGIWQFAACIYQNPWTPKPAYDALKCALSQKCM